FAAGAGVDGRQPAGLLLRGTAQPGPRLRPQRVPLLGAASRRGDLPAGLLHCACGVPAAAGHGLLLAGAAASARRWGARGLVPDLELPDALKKRTQVTMGSSGLGSLLQESSKFSAEVL